MGWNKSAHRRLYELNSFNFGDDVLLCIFQQLDSEDSRSELELAAVSSYDHSLDETAACWEFFIGVLQ